MRAHRYQCLSQGTATCDRGDGNPGRRLCRRCGGKLLIESDMWAVFTWTRSGRYPSSAAHATFARRDVADRYAARNSDWVSRFIPD